MPLSLPPARRPWLLHALIALLLPAILPAMSERHIIHLESAIPAIDGKLDDWANATFHFWGDDSPSEATASGQFAFTWNNQGLSWALKVHQPGVQAGNTEEQVELFIDTRPPSGLRYDRFARGVFRLVVRPGAPDRSIEFFNNKRPIRNLNRAGVKTAWSRETSSWIVEAFLPWSALEYTPSISTPISIAVLLQMDGRTDQRITPGVDDVGRKSLRDGPMGFWPYFFSDTPGPRSYLCAQEILVGDEPWIEVECTLPAEAASPTKEWLEVSCQEAGLRRKIPFRRSLGGRFWTARERYPLPLVAPAEAKPLPVTLTLGPGGESRVISTSTPVWFKRREILIALPSTEIDKLPERRRALANLYKEAALEAAARLSPVPDSTRPPQVAIRAILNPSLADQEVSMFVKYATDAIVGVEHAVTASHWAWQSRIDGRWLPIIVTPPWNRDPAKRYGAKLDIQGLVRRTRATFLANAGGLHRYHATGQAPQAAGDVYTIQLWGRGNSHQIHGEEELRYVFDHLLPTLGVDRARVSICGHSDGAIDALTAALRHPDRFSHLIFRSGVNPDNLFDGKAPAEDIALLLRNLSQCALYLEVGANDKSSLPITTRLAGILSALSIRHESQVVPGKGHVFQPRETPRSIAGSSIPDRPLRFDYSTYSLDDGAAYWAKITAIENWGKLASISVDLEKGGHLQIETGNVRALVFGGTRFDPVVPISEITIDGTRIQPGNHLPLALDKIGGRWKLAEEKASPPPRHKREGQSGPSVRILHSPAYIVYGTKNPALAYALRHRAVSIAQSLVGIESDQIGGGKINILADTDVTEEHLALNLWLIGGPEENWLAGSLGVPIPGQMAAHGATLGNQHYAGNHQLLSFIYPNPRSPGRYVYWELGSSELAYRAPILADRNKDITLQEVGPHKTELQWSGYFNSHWEIQSEKSH